MNAEGTDNRFMKEAIKIASDNVERGGGPFGAVIVKDGEIIAGCHNRVTLDNDPTAHAEVNAIRTACKKLGTFDLSGCTIYTSCEPCPMCLGAIYWARLDRIYYGATRAEAAKAGFADNFIYEELSKEFPDRSLRIDQMLHAEAQEPFRLWHDKEDRIDY